MYGKPSIKNCHSHYNCKKEIWVVHKDIFENYQVLKKNLIDQGHKFISDIDTNCVSVLKELDVDKPRNLAKSVMVK